MHMSIDPKVLAIRLRARSDGRPSGLHSEEITAVLRALELGVMHIDSEGRLHNNAMRAPKAGGYEFTDAQGHFIAWPELTTEVLTVVRLIDDHGWPAHLIKMERTPFDVCTFATEDRAAPVVIATEEKHSPDQARTLLAQLRSFARRKLQPADKALVDPSERQDFPKYLGLCGFKANGETLHAPQWFVVAAPTVWRAFRVSQLTDHALLEEIDPGGLPRGD